MQLIENTLTREQSQLIVTKAKALPHGQFEAILSTDDLDRHGEHVSIKGLKIPKTVIKMYYNHETNGMNLPIGKWLRIWKAEGKLMGLGEVDIEDDFALKVYKKVLKGYIDSISIGFYPEEYDGEASTWTKSTLVEASVVAEPANVNAVITQKDLGFSEAEFKKALKVRLKQVKDDDVFVGEPGFPDEAVVEDPATYNLQTPDQSEPAIDSESEEAPSKDAAVDTEVQGAVEELKSRVGALEQAHQEANENPATKNIIKVRLAAKQVVKAGDALNTVLRVKLKETN